VDKPAGMTSHDVVQRVRRVLGLRAVGHTGTLDPFATGLLVLLLGRATRLARFLDRQTKQYLATARLGIRTSTDDLTGRVTAQSSDWELVSRSTLEQELGGLEGEQLQQPPQFSAKQVAGERSYRKARRGEVASLEPARVTVHLIELIEYQPPDVTFRAEVSTGTYIRALARDLGERLGVGAHLTELRRQAIGSLRVEDAVTLEQIGPDAVMPAHAVLPDLPRVELDATARNAVAHGQAVVDGREAGRRGGGAAVALLAAGELVAVAEEENGLLRPKVVLERV
jgi:tRNA pseudouridine55 synthase